MPLPRLTADTRQRHNRSSRATFCRRNHCRRTTPLPARPNEHRLPRTPSRRRRTLRLETRPARVWRAEAETFAEEVRVDVNGNSYAGMNLKGGPIVMLAGHIDEIGLQVTHIDDDGYLYVDEIGGWIPRCWWDSGSRSWPRTATLLA